MKIQIIRDENIVARMEKEREESAFKKYFDLLCERLDGLHFQEMGGSIRDIIISEMYGVPYQPRDFDFLVDDSEEEVDLYSLCHDLPGFVRPNFLGNPKWLVDGLEIDVSKYSTRRDKRKPRNLKAFFHGCDFNIGTIVYCWQHRQVLAYNAVEGIRDRRISLMNPEEDRPEATISKAILFEKKLGFELDDCTLGYILKMYSREMDPRIQAYLAYKTIPKEFDYVIARLQELIS